MTTTQTNGLTLMSEKGNNLATVTPEKFAKEIGELLKANSGKLKFNFEGSEITVPAASSADGVQRFHSIVKGIVSAICSPLEKDQDVKNPAHVQLVEALKKTGFHFAGTTRAAIEEGVKIRIAAKNAVITLRKTETRDLKENRVYISVTNTARTLNRLIKEEGRGAAIAKLDELKKAKQDGGLKLLTES